jgi:hypothetical protein
MSFNPQEYKNEWLKALLRRRRDEWLAENGPCRWCGSWADLEVDHIDPATKCYSVSRLWGWSADRRNTELMKCQPLCVACHAIKTKKERQEAARERTSRAEHGTRRMYDKGKCRCDACKLWRRDAQRDLNARKKQSRPDGVMATHLD